MADAKVISFALAAQLRAGEADLRQRLANGGRLVGAELSPCGDYVLLSVSGRTVATLSFAAAELLATRMLEIVRAGREAAR